MLPFEEVLLFLFSFTLMDNSLVKLLAKILIIVGSINWGLIGLGNFFSTDLNVVHMVLGGMPQVEWVVYILVGLSGILCLLKCRKCR